MKKNLKKTMLFIGVILAIFVFFSIVFNFFADKQGSYFGMMGPRMMDNSGFVLLYILGTIIFGIIIWMVLTSFQDSKTINNKNQKSNTPLEILKERYARGEIDKKEYETKKNDLK